jgi:hypothetical protein
MFSDFMIILRQLPETTEKGPPGGIGDVRGK